MLILAVLVLIIIAKTAIVVPQQSAYVVERLGRYRGTLSAGFHVLLPFVDVIRYRHSLKETAVDIPAQVCITRDNVQVGVDGVLYLKVLNPERASYGISDYIFAITQLAQTTLRSEVGKIDLDKTFEERTNINTAVVTRARQGVGALGRQGAALRDQEHHAAARHPRGDGEADARRAREARRDPHLRRHARRRHQHRGRREAGSHQGVGSAQGSSRSTRPKARRPRSWRSRPRPRKASGSVAEAIKLHGGYEAVQLRVAEQYIAQFGELAKKSNTLVLPANVADVGSMIALAMAAIKADGAGGGAAPRGAANPIPMN